MAISLKNIITEQEPLATDEQREAHDRNVPNAQQVLFGAHLLVLGGIENSINKFIKS